MDEMHWLCKATWQKYIFLIVFAWDGKLTKQSKLFWYVIPALFSIPSKKNWIISHWSKCVDVSAILAPCTWNELNGVVYLQAILLSNEEKELKEIYLVSLCACCLPRLFSTSCYINIEMLFFMGHLAAESSEWPAQEHHADMGSVGDISIHHLGHNVLYMIEGWNWWRCMTFLISYYQTPTPPRLCHHPAFTLMSEPHPQLQNVAADLRSRS